MDEKAKEAMSRIYTKARHNPLARRFVELESFSELNQWEALAIAFDVALEANDSLQELVKQYARNNPSMSVMPPKEPHHEND